MYSDTIVFETVLRALYSHALREGRMLAHHGVMSAGVGASGRFYNTHRGLGGVMSTTIEVDRYCSDDDSGRT